MKKYFPIIVLLFLVGYAYGPREKDIIFQNAPINALMAGCYSGTMTIQEIKEHGDFGLGTLNALDGELIALDGSFYQIKSNGKVYLLEGSEESPFAAVTFFEADQKFSLYQAMDYPELKHFLDEKIASPNLPYAIKVEGEFEAIKVRSPVRQEKPYAVLTEAIKEQKFFELSDQKGTLVGFRTPSYMEGVNVPGYHFHFLNSDKTSGGHVLSFRLYNPYIEVDEGDGFLMELSKNREFLNFSFEAGSGEALAKVEK